MGNQQVLDKIGNRVDGAIRAITVPDIGDSVLQPEKAARFIQIVSESTPLLDECRIVTMGASQTDFDRTGFGQRILKDPAETDIDEKPTFDTEKLNAKEKIAIVGVKDDTLEDNIEGEQFGDTLIDMSAERVGLDVEYYNLQADSDLDSNTNKNLFLRSTDGWLKTAINKVVSNDTEQDFDPENVESFLQALFRATPRKFIRNRADWRFYIGYDPEDEYRDKLRARGTGLGDIAQTQDTDLRFKGFPVRPVPNMPAGWGMFTHPNNLVYGIRRDIRVEPDRKPRDRQTDFIITMRIDATMENPNATTVGEGYEGVDVWELSS